MNSHISLYLISVINTWRFHSSKQFFIWILVTLLLPINSVHGQVINPNTWFNESQTWFQLVVANVTQTHSALVQEGSSNFGAMYKVNVSNLINEGFPDQSVPEKQLKVYLKGIEIPILIDKNETGNLTSGDAFYFFGERNTGKNENWAYGSNGSDQKSTFYSLYSDTSYYWLTWSETPGKRYQLKNEPISDTFFTGFRDTLHNEAEETGFYQGYDSFAELSTYGESEGQYYCDIDMTSLASKNVTFKNALYDIQRVDSTIYFQGRLASASNGSRTVRLQLNHLLNGTIAYHTIGSKTWSGKGEGIVTGSISPVRLINYGELDFYFNIINDNASLSTPHLMYFDWYRFSYYRGFSIRSATHQFSFRLKADGQKSVTLKNIAESDTVVVFSPSRGVYFETNKNSSTQTATFFDKEAQSTSHLYVAVKNKSYPLPVSIRKVTLSADLLSANNEATVIILTRPFFKAQAQIYANYRAARSKVPVKLVIADDVWQVFGHGIQTPKAIQDFIHYARQTWKTKPEYLFILADASLQLRNSRIAANEIPSFGFPSSDTWFGMNQVSATDWTPRVSVGRLTAKTQAEAIAYLSKVSQYESDKAEYDLWQKRVTLLSGGFDDSERQLLYLYNKKIGALTANSIIAADTTIIGKQSNQPLDASIRGDLSTIINNGTFILHFYGHSSPDSWDLLTDNPSAYQNKGKLSVILSMGCYSGLFTTSGDRVISEQFVMAPNAAIAFIGGSGQGHPSALQNYADGFYKYIFNDTTAVLGDVDRKARIDMIKRFSTIPLLDLALLQNTTVIGDPSIRLAYPKKPDYRFDYNPVSYSPTQTNVSDSIFYILPRIRNLGTRPSSVSSLKISHLSPSGKLSDNSVPIQPVYTVSELVVPVKIVDEDAGLHRFDFEINPENEIVEYSLNNNILSSEHLVYSTGADLIYPPAHSNHNSVKPLFVLSSPTIINGETFDIEVDSVPNFEFPMASTSLISNQLNARWEPDLTLVQNKEYFWRAKVKRDEEENWRTANFTVDTTKTGTWWIQQPREFPENTLSSSLSYSDSLFSFNTVSLGVRTSTLTYALANSDAYKNYPASTFVNGEQMGRLTISFYMIVINGLTGEIRNGLDSQGFPRGQHYAVHFGIFTNTGALSKAQFITDLNAINPGDIVILRVRNFNLINPNSSLFSDSFNDPLIGALRSVGAFKAAGGVDGRSPAALATTDGYILFGKKFANASQYDPSQVSEYIVKDRNNVFEADTTYLFNSSEGSMTTGLIGPVKSWKRFEGGGDRVSPTGKLFIDIYGQQSQASSPVRLLTSNPNGLGTSFSSDLTSINPIQYPYLRLIARLENPDRKTPQLERWRIQYEPLPELGIDGFSARTNTDSLEEGYTYKFNINVQNLGLIDADTVIIDYLDVFKPRNGLYQTTLLKKDTLLNFDAFRKTGVTNPITTKQTDLTLNTLGLQGDHTLQVRFQSGFQDQFSYNNFYSRDFYVQKDSIAPQIEVFVDNRFLPPVTQPITDKENPNLSFVSSKPVIDIYWKDSNPYLRVQDSTTIEIRMFTSNRSDYTIYNYLNPEVRFVPATEVGALNEAYVEFTPDFSAYGDTTITLQIFSRDLSGNAAEDKENGYIISFRVSQEEGMTSFYPYPNPMSNFTNFAFELQGSDISTIEQLKLKLFTLSGRPIKVVDLLNNPFLLNDGRLRIGWNVYRWDGLDDDGDRLATGVYLYHVDFKAAGKTIKVNNSTSVEKLVIVR